MLGLEPDAAAEELRIVRPRLPVWLERVRLRRLSVGKSKVDLTIHRRDNITEVDIGEITGRLKVSVVR